MANNRMYLVFNPTGSRVYLGKRMSWGWYDVPDDVKAKLENLFDEVSMHSADQDDFGIEFEVK